MTPTDARSSASLPHRWTTSGLLPGLLGVLLLASPLAGQEPPPEPTPIQPGMKSPPGTYDTGLSALHYDITLHLSDDQNWIRGDVAIRMRAERGGVTSAQLDFTGLAVTSARVDGARAPHAAEAGRLTIPLGRTLNAGDEVVVEIAYRGVPDDALQLRTNVYGNAAAFVDNWPNRTRFWLPSVDHPSDKATARFTVDAPEAWEVVANGRQVGQPYPTPPDSLGPEEGPRRTWVYVTEVPHPTYTLVVGAADMVITPLGTGACGRAPASSRADGCVEVTTWLFPRSVETASPSFARAVEMLDFFTDVIGPYPFEKLAHVQSSTRFGGMENSSAIFYDERALAAGRDIEGTVSHEVAHQWFGDSVTPSDWSELWLSEGFATYFGNVFFEYADGEEAFRERMAAAAARYLSSVDTLSPVVDTSKENLFDLLNRNSYQKGGWVLHMLRGIVGDEPFFEAMRVFYERYTYGNADSGDLQEVVQEVTGTDLDWFFEPWLHRPGYPVLAVERAADEATGDLVVTLRQVQGEYAPRFRLPLELELAWDGGTRRERVTLEGASGTFAFEGIPPDADVVVDPDGWVLMRLAGES